MGNTAIELGIRIFIALCGLFVLAGALRILYDHLKAKSLRRDSATGSRAGISRAAPPASAGPHPPGRAGGDTTGAADRGEMSLGFEFSGAAAGISESRGGDAGGGEINGWDAGESGEGFGDFGGGGDYGGGGSGGGWS